MAEVTALMRRHKMLLGTAAVWLLVTAIYLGVGASGVSLVDLLKALAGQLDEEQSYLVNSVLFDIRLPRFLKCIVAGSGMALAGVLTQGLFRNSLAAPSVLGMTSGAGLASAVVYFLGWQTFAFWTLPLASFVGASVLAIILILMTRSFATISTEGLLLAGFAFNILCGALISLFLSVALETPRQMPSIMHWLMGDFSYPISTYLWLPAIVVALGALLSYRLSPYLEVFSLGEDVSLTLALEPSRLKIAVLFVVALLVAGSVSLVGAVPFVGLIVPHSLRYLFGASLKRLTLLSLFFGPIYVLIADLLAKTVRSPGELQTGILLALVGAPFFIFVLLYEKRGEREI